jgi:Tetratricopeptide repeat
MIPPGPPHLTHDQIAQLAAGYPGDAAGEALDHLARCSACQEAVRESATWLAAWTHRPETFADAGDAAKVSRSFLEEVGVVTRRAGRRRSWSLVGASLAAVAVVAFLIAKPGHRDTGSAATVEAAIRGTALLGDILIPGAEHGSVTVPGARRSGLVADPESAGIALHELAEKYVHGSADEQVTATLVAGYLALGQIGSARDFVRDARRRFPGDETIEVLDGLVDYCDGRFPEAEARLRSAVARAPDNDVARVNLARLLSDTGRRAEALSLARSIRESTRNPVIAARADSILAGARPGG